MPIQDPYQLQRLLLEVAELTANKLAAQLGKLKDEISERQAYREFGQTNVNRWRIKGAVKRIKVGERNCKVTYSRNELLAIQKAERLAIMMR